MQRLSVGLLGLVFISAVLPQTNRPVNPTPASAAPPIDVYDGFESATLSNAWDTSRFTAGAVQMQSEVVREGHGAVKIAVKSHDMFEAGQSGDADSERDELMEARSLVSKENASYEYSFSMFFPERFSHRANAAGHRAVETVLPGAAEKKSK